MKKALITFSVVCFATYGLRAQSEKRNVVPIAPISSAQAGVSSNGEQSITANAQVNSILISASGITVASTESAPLKPERVTQPTRRDVIVNGKLVSPEAEDNVKEKAKQ